MQKDFQKCGVGWPEDQEEDALLLLAAKAQGGGKKFGCLCSSKAMTWEFWWPAVTLQGHTLT